MWFTFSLEINVNFSIQKKHLKIFTKDSVGINSTAYSFCKILNTHFSKDYLKGFPYTMNIIENLEEAVLTDRSTIDLAARPIRKATEKYWMHELRTNFKHGLNGRVGNN